MMWHILKIAGQVGPPATGMNFAEFHMIAKINTPKNTKNTKKHIKPINDNPFVNFVSLGFNHSIKKVTII
jgi:hypothetical protein